MRSLAVLSVVATAACLGLPAAAGADLTVSGYPVPSSLDAVPSNGNTQVEPAIAPAPDGSNAEWFVVSGQSQNVVSITPTGQQARVASGLASDAGTPDNYASVDAEGYDWILDNDQGPGNVLYAVGAANSASPGLNPVARFGDYGQDMTLGPDGALYVSDNNGLYRCQITAAPSAVCNVAAIPPPFYTGAGAFAIGAGGNAVWFTDGIGELGAYSGSGITGPYPQRGATVGSPDPGTIVAGSDGYIYAASGAEQNANGNNNEIVVFSPGDPNSVRVAASGLGNVVAMTIGPDGNVWFLDASGSGYVGELAVSNDTVSSYRLPAGLSLPQSGWRIANGPAVPSTSGTGEVFFTGASSTGNAEVGEVSGIPFPVAPGILAFEPSVSVSKRHVAVMRLSCTGESNSQCAGSIALSVRAKVRVQVQVRAAKKGARARFRAVTETRALTLGTISYAVHGGGSLRATMTLTNAAYNLLEKVSGHSWRAAVTSTTTVGTVTGTQLTMIGPVPPKPKPKPKPKVKPKHSPTHRATKKK